MKLHMSAPVARQDLRNYPKLRAKDGAARPHGSGPFLTRPTALDPFPAWGWVRRRHVSLRKGSSELTAEASDPRRSPGPLASIRTSHTAWGSGAATCPGGTGSYASLPLEDSPSHRIQCWWLRRALPPQHAGHPLSGPTVHRVLPRYTVQPHPRRARLPH